MPSDDILRKKLEVARREHAVVDVFRDAFGRQPLTGRVLAHGDHVVFVANLTAAYEADGVVALRTRDISRLRTGTRELTLNGPVARWEPLPEIEDARVLSFTGALHALARNFEFGRRQAKDNSAEAKRAAEFISVADERMKLHWVGELVDVDAAFVRLRALDTDGDRYDLVLREDEITSAEGGDRFARQLVEATRFAETPRH